MYPFLAIKETL